MAGWKQLRQMSASENSDACSPDRPFWWMGPNNRQTADFELSDAYETAPKLQEVERVDVVNEMKLGDEKEYLPGEIATKQKSPLQVGHRCGIVEWTPKSPDFYKPFDPDSVPRSNNYLYNAVKRRQMMDLASTLKEDSDYNAKNVERTFSESQVSPTPIPYGALGSAPVQPMSGHPVNEFGYNPATLTCCQRIIEATSGRIAGTNPFCFRDVIGRN